MTSHGSRIHYQMLKHRPENSLKTLLSILNYIWTTGKFPKDWPYATIITIPKPSKDPAEHNKYRPKALTRCLCKTLERLSFFTKSNGLKKFKLFQYQYDALKYK